MKNVFDDNIGIDFFWVSQKLVPKVKTIFFLPSKPNKAVEYENKNFIYTENTGIDDGYWFFNMPFYRAITKASGSFLFGYYLDGFWKVYRYMKTGNELEKIREGTINNGVMPFDLPYFSAGNYIAHQSKCSLTRREAIIIHPQSLNVLKSVNDNIDEYLGATEEQLLSSVPLIYPGIRNQYVASKINFVLESLYASYPESVIRENVDKLDFKLISLNPGLGIDFIEEYIDRLDLEEVIKRIHLPEEFILRHLHRFRLVNLLTHRMLSEQALNAIKDRFTGNDWKIVSRRQVLSGKFISENIDKLNIKALLENNRNNLPDNFVKKLDSVRSLM